MKSHFYKLLISTSFEKAVKVSFQLLERVFILGVLSYISITLTTTNVVQFVAIWILHFGMTMIFFLYLISLALKLALKIGQNKSKLSSTLLRIAFGLLGFFAAVIITTLISQIVAQKIF